VVWGVEDFRSRFGRLPEGMWLPETAVDLETLDILSSAGIKFTILAPHQAHRIRPAGARNWIHVDDESKLDITRPYLVNLPSGRSISVFFYSGPVSRAVAFEGLLKDGAAFADRLAGIFSSEDRPQLAHIATDGESYGHHSRFADMALAYCIHHVEKEGLAQITNYGEFLAKFPAQWQAEIRENTSWSCFHGVERWRANCGCNTGGHPGWAQAWRAPLRESFDWMNGRLAETFGKDGANYFREPWKARDGYIKVILDRSEESVERFLAERRARELGREDKEKALKLLEIQRHAMLMFTSCGWFFDDLSGIETVQVIQYAGRAAQLHRELYGDGLEDELALRLSKAASNIPEQGTGRDIYLRHVRGKMVDLRKVAVHYAISSLFEEYAEKEPLYCYDVTRDDYERHEAAGNELAMGRIRIRSRVTWSEAVQSFGVIKIGSADISCGLCDCTAEEMEAMKKELRESFLKGAVAESLRLMDRHLGSHTYSTKDLFTDEQRKILSLTVGESLKDFEKTYIDLYEKEKFLVGLLGEMNAPVPKVFLWTAEFALKTELRGVFEEDGFDIEMAAPLFGELSALGIKTDAEEFEIIVREKLGRLMKELSESPSAELMAKVKSVLGFVKTLPFRVNLWEAQNIYYGMAKTAFPGMAARGDEASRRWGQEFRELGKGLFFSVDKVLNVDNVLGGGA
jgi:hypothetical protein